METEQSGDTMQSASRPAALLFINITHPRDATAPSSLRQIRSHAAKEMRSRARKTRKTVLLPPRAARKARASGAVEPPDPSAGGKHGQEQTCPTPTTSENPASEDPAGVEPFASVPASSPLFDVNWVMGLSSLYPCWNAARPFSHKENALLDHYINYIVPFIMGSCHRNRNRGNSREQLVAMQLSCWVPFALSDIGLIAALFLQSSRSLETFDTPRRDEYIDASTQYRLQCIRSTNASLSSDTTQSNDATIAKVMVMAADEFTLGNFNAWSAHIVAITQMIKMRGGIDALGVGGFLKEVITNTPMCYGY